jgi:hypothetical protein
MKRAALILALMTLATPGFATDATFENGAPVTLKPNMGYILVRNPRDERALATINYSPVLIRSLDQAELEKTGHEANVVVPPADRPYAHNDTEIIQVMALKPGTYVLGGIANLLRSGWTSARVTVSLCMGTVMFEVKPGVITDLGTILLAQHDKPTTIPELAKVVAGKDTDLYFVLFDVAIRPLGPNTPTPEALKSLPIMSADYHTYGWFPNYLGADFNRLAPIPGVLDYDKDGNPIDVKTGTKTP